MTNTYRPKTIVGQEFSTPIYGYRCPPGVSLEQALKPEFWCEDGILRQLKPGDLIRIVDPVGPRIAEIVVQGVSRFSAVEADKLNLAYRPVWPPNLDLPQPGAMPSMRVSYNRSSDIWEIVDRDGRVLDQLADEEAALRTMALMTRRPAPAAAEPEAPTALSIAMLAARPLRREKPKAARPRGRPRKSPSRSPADDAAPMAAAAEEV
jgi:hypothetical protein